MKELVFDRIEGMRDIVVLYAGAEQCAPCHSYGPHVRTNHLLHYCLSGRGRLFDKYGEHEVRAGELFIIRPGEVTTYTADKSDPWKYVWIGFSGERASVFSTDRSVYQCPTEPFLRLYELSQSFELSPDIYTSIIYEIIYLLFSGHEKGGDTLSKIKKYVRYNYMLSITAESVSREFGYERTYLYRIFKKRYGIGVKEYIIKVRMDNARAFLLDGHTVAETASLCGYGDEFNFSRAYKKHYGYPPSRTGGEGK